MIARALPYALLLLVGLMGKYVYDERRRAEGLDRAWLQQVAAERDTVRLLRDSLARGHRADTVRLTRLVVRRDTVFQTHTRWLTDTVPVPVEVVREIVAADSAVIDACQVALGSCHEITNALRLDLSLAEKQRDYWQRRAAPSLLTRISTAAKWLGAGYGACKVMSR